MKQFSFQNDIPWLDKPQKEIKSLLCLRQVKHNN
jgi:hypothetical protein